MPHFDHEKLKVYQESVRFFAWAEAILTSIPKSIPAQNQLDRASTSVPLNIPEGNGKHTPPDRCKYFDIARVSALECAACLDVLVAKKKIEETRANEGRSSLLEIVSMLIGLIRANSPDRNV